MDYPITDQPGMGFGMPKQNNPDNLEGLERLAQLPSLTVKQRHPGCLERKIFSLIHHHYGYNFYTRFFSS